MRSAAFLAGAAYLVLPAVCATPAAPQGLKGSAAQGRSQSRGVANVAPQTGPGLPGTLQSFYTEYAVAIRSRSLAEIGRYHAAAAARDATRAANLAKAQTWWRSVFTQLDRIDNSSMSDVHCVTPPGQARVAAQWVLLGANRARQPVVVSFKLEDVLVLARGHWLIVEEHAYGTPATPPAPPFRGKPPNKPAPHAGFRGSSGVEGDLVVGPLAPNQTAGSSNTRPLAHGIVSVRPVGSGLEVARDTADAQGHFRISLPPGAYFLLPVAPNGRRIGMGFAKPVRVTVAAGAFTRVVVTYDTGIR